MIDLPERCLEVRCPKCEAPAGHPCLTARSKLAAKPHTDRLREWPIGLGLPIVGALMRDLESGADATVFGYEPGNDRCAWLIAVRLTGYSYEPGRYHHREPRHLRHYAEDE